MVSDSLYSNVSSRMKDLVALLLLESLGLAWGCSPLPWATNIASSGQASQVGTLSTFTANKAFDGSKDLDATHGFCAHTNKVMNSWWRLDMGESLKIEIVVVWGRTDDGLQWLNGLEVRIGDSPDNNNPVCGKISGTVDLKTTFCCDGMEGRYISLVIPGRSEYLVVCEVEVYDDSMYETCW
ncbi:fucolectin-5-like [Mantella aurantiaca]